MHFASPGCCQGLDWALTWATLMLLIVIDGQQRFYYSSLRYCNRRKHIRGLKKPCCSQKPIHHPPHLDRKKKRQTPHKSFSSVVTKRFSKTEYLRTFQETLPNNECPETGENASGVKHALPAVAVQHQGPHPTCD